MTDSIPDNNEFSAAERALRKIGSNLWFGGLSDGWRDFLISHTVECFDTYEVSMLEAAQLIVRIYRQVVLSSPDVTEKDPWEIGLDVTGLLRDLENCRN